jgi:AraC-like DNA-binding protein
MNKPIMPLEMRPHIVLQTAKGSSIGRITLAGLLRDHIGVPEKPVRMLGSYALVYLLRGKGKFSSANGIRRTLVPGDLLTVFPDIPHWYGPSQGSVWDEFYIVFSGEVFDLWRTTGLLNPAKPVRHLEPLDYWLRRLEEVVVGEKDSLQQVCSLQHVLAEALEATEILSGPPWVERAQTLLGKGENVSLAAVARALGISYESFRQQFRSSQPVLAKALEAAEIPSAPPWIESARTLLRNTENVSLAAVARALGMSYETFRKQFAAATGTSPNHYHLTKLIDRACALIVAEGATNKEIAQRLGFCDEFHFSRQFSKIVGISPMHFRLKLPRKLEEQRSSKVRRAAR